MVMTRRVGGVALLVLALVLAGSTAVLASGPRHVLRARLLRAVGASTLRPLGVGGAPDGEAGTLAAHGLTTVPVAGTRGWVWHPSGPLPAPSRQHQATLVVLSPHPDDETLSMGVLVADAERAGERCVVVAMTDGGSTGAYGALRRRWRAWQSTAHAGRLARGLAVVGGPGTRPPGSPAGAEAPLTRRAVAAARISEMRAAVSHLGVAPDDVVLAHLDAATSDDGARTTVAEAAAVIRVLARQFPEATFVTMSDVAERQPDHLDDGTALHLLAEQGVVAHAEFAVSRLWWGLPAPAPRWVLPRDAVVADEVRSAAHEYGRWDPRDLRLAVGYTSVRHQFAELLRDPRDRVHTDAPTAGEVSAAAMPAARAA